MENQQAVDFLSTRLHEILEKVPADVRLCMRFMHDAAPSHFSRVARQFLQINGLVVEVLFAWPARSLDLNPLDFHLWRHLKSIVHATSIENAETLRNTRLPTNSRNTRNDRESNQMNDKTRAGLSSNARRSFLCIFCKSN